MIIHESWPKKRWPSSTWTSSNLAILKCGDSGPSSQNHQNLSRWKIPVESRRKYVPMADIADGRMKRTGQKKHHLPSFTIIYHHLPIFSKSMELQIHLDHLGSAMINASRQNIYVYQYHPGINQKLVDSSAIAGSGGSGNSSERARCCQRLNGCLGGVHFSQQFTDRSCLCLKRSIDIKKDHNNKYLYLSCIETYSLQRIRTLLAALVGVIMHVFFLNTSHRLHRRPHCRKKRKSRPVKIMGQEPPKSLCNVASFLPKTFVVTLW